MKRVFSIVIAVILLAAALMLFGCEKEKSGAKLNEVDPNGTKQGTQNVLGGTGDNNANNETNDKDDKYGDSKTVTNTAEKLSSKDDTDDGGLSQNNTGELSPSDFADGTDGDKGGNNRENGSDNSSSSEIENVMSSESAIRDEP